MEIILFVSILFILIISFFLIRRKKEPEREFLQSLRDLGALKTQIDNIVMQQSNFGQTLTRLETGLKTVESKIIETSGSVKETLSKDLEEARRVMDAVKTAYEARKKLEEDIQNATRRIENVIVGSYSRGASGENILHEAFKLFPAGMIDYNFKVRGRPVEYALVLTNQKRLPIDSKWPGLEILEQLTQELDLQQRKKLEEEIEKILIRKIKEVTQYIDPLTTTNTAVAAVPDAVFKVCRRAHVEAFQDRVLLMPYSMTIPYILALYNLHLQYARSVDIENLEGYLYQIEHSLENIDKTLENSIAKGATMITNAYNECKRLLGEIRAATAYLRSIPTEISRDSLPGGGD